MDDFLSTLSEEERVRFKKLVDIIGYEAARATFVEAAHTSRALEALGLRYKAVRYLDNEPVPATYDNIEDWLKGVSKLINKLPDGDLKDMFITHMELLAGLGYPQTDKPAYGYPEPQGYGYGVGGKPVQKSGSSRLERFWANWRPARPPSAPLSR